MQGGPQKPTRAVGGKITPLIIGGEITTGKPIEFRPFIGGLTPITPLITNRLVQ